MHMLTVTGMPTEECMQRQSQLAIVIFLSAPAQTSAGHNVNFSLKMSTMMMDDLKNYMNLHLFGNTWH